MQETYNLLQEIGTLDLPTRTSNAITRDVRNALAVEDYERAAELTQDAIAKAESASKARAIIRNLEEHIRPNDVTGVSGRSGVTTGNVLTGNVLTENVLAEPESAAPIGAVEDTGTADDTIDDIVDVTVNTKTGISAGTVTLGGAPRTPITESLIERARLAIDMGDYDAGLALAKQAEITYVMEQKLSLGVPEIFTDYGVLLIVVVLMTCVLLFFFVTLLRRRDAMIIAQEKTTPLPHVGEVIRSATLSRLSQWRDDYAHMSWLGKAILVLFVVLFITSSALIIAFHLKADAALQQTEINGMAYSADNSALYLEIHRMNAEAIVEDLESVVLSDLDDDRAREDPEYLSNLIAHTTPALRKMALDTPSVQGIYVTFNPDRYNAMYTTWYVREGGTFVYRPDSDEFDPEYLRANSTRFSEDEGYVWYYDILRNPVPQWTAAYFDNDLEMYVISYIRPLMIDGEFAGIVGVDMTLQDVQRAMAFNSNGQTVIVLDSDGNFVTGSPEDVRSWEHILPFLTDDRGGFTIDNQDIGYKILANGMTVIVVADEATSPLPIENLQAFLRTTHVMVILALFCLWLYVNSIFLRLFRDQRSITPKSFLGRVMRIAIVMLIVPVFAFMTFSWTSSTLRSVDEASTMMSADHLAAELEPTIEYIRTTAGHLRDVVAEKFDLAAASNNRSYVSAYMDSVSDDVRSIGVNTNDLAGIYFYLDPDKYLDPVRGVSYSWFSVKDGIATPEEDTGVLIPGYLSMHSAQWRDDPNYVWYYDAIRKGRGTWTGVYYDEDLGYDCVSYIAPVYKNYRLIGVAGIDLNLNAVQRKVSSCPHIQGDAYLFDQEGTFFVGDPSSIRSWETIAELLTLDRGGFVVDEQNVGYRKLPNGMIVMVVTREETDDVVLVELHRDLLKMVLFFGVLTEIVLGGILLANILLYNRSRRSP